MFDFFHAVSAPFRMQPGLRRLAPGVPQLTPTAPGSAHTQAKRAVLAAQWASALQCAPGFDPTAPLDALAAHAAREHPQAWRVSEDGVWHAAAHGLAVTQDGAVQGEDPLLTALPRAWRRAALLCLAFEEDVAIVDGARATLPWLAVCLPSHWRPTDKIGRHFTEVHAPVADNAVLQAAGAHLFKLVCGPHAWERFVWNVSRLATLDAHPDRHAAAPWPADVAAAWFRTERQTFIPLPAQQQAVFTIGVQVRPLAQALPTPAHAQALHDAIASMSPAVLAYRSLTSAREPLLRWLAARAAANPADPAP